MSARNLHEINHAQLHTPAVTPASAVRPRFLDIRALLLYKSNHAVSTDRRCNACVTQVRSERCAQCSILQAPRFAPPVYFPTKLRTQLRALKYSTACPKACLVVCDVAHCNTRRALACHLATLPPCLLHPYPLVLTFWAFAF